MENLFEISGLFSGMAAKVCIGVQSMHFKVIFQRLVPTRCFALWVSSSPSQNEATCWVAGVHTARKWDEQLRAVCTPEWVQ